MKIVWLVTGCVVLGLALGVGLAAWDLGWLGPGHATGSWGAEDVLPLPPEGEPQPKAVVPQQEVDFGRLAVGRHGHHDFVIRNEGPGELVLRPGSDRSCACAGVEVPRRPVPPGGEAAVRLSWEARQTNPLFREYATVLTNDRRRRRIRLTVVGEVVLPVKAVPRDLLFRGIVEGQSASAEARLYCYDSDGFEVVDTALLPGSRAAWIEVTVGALDEQDVARQDASSGALVRVSLKPGLPRGTFQQRIRLLTNLSRLPELELRALGEVLPAVTVAGRGWDGGSETLSLGPPVAGKPVTREVLIRVRGPGHAEVELTVDRVRPSVVKVETGSPAAVGDDVTSFPLRIEVPPDAVAESPQGEPFGEILITTTHPVVKQVRLRLAMP